MNADNIREKLEKKKLDEADSKKMITDGFMSGIKKLMYDFNKKVDSKQIEIKDPNDLYKLFVIFSQMQNMVSDGDSNSGLLPQLSSKQQQLFEDVVETSGNGERFVNLDKISELSPDDIASMIADKEKAMNEENSETF